MHRYAAYRCLKCPDSPMRLLMGDRLVCDTCQSLMLEQDDLESAVMDLTGELPLLDDQSTIPRGCPRCGHKLAVTQLRAGKYVFEGELPRCPSHGVWFEAEQLVTLFEDLGRRGHRGSARGKYSGGVGDVLIVHGRKRKRAPRGTPYVTAYADRTLGCPTCARALVFDAGRWTCGGCRGVLVEDAAIEAMIASMTGAPWQLPAMVGGEGARLCPICTAPMFTEDLEGVPVDRCAGHGVWFDADELEEALRHSTEPEPRGIKKWLRSLR